MVRRSYPILIRLIQERACKRNLQSDRLQTGFYRKISKPLRHSGESRNPFFALVILLNLKAFRSEHNGYRLSPE
jgi:hypothetical protein